RRPGVASGISRSVFSALVVLAGLTSTATRTALGAKSCKSPRRLATSSPKKILTPVALPPGRARLATSPSLTGSSATRKTIGVVVVAALAASAAPGTSGAITATRLPTRSVMSDGKRLYPPQPVILDRHVLAVDIAGLVEALTECSTKACGFLGRPAGHEADNRHRRLLRARRERPRSRASEQRDERASLHLRGHSITSSARASSVGGTSRPSALAV